MNPLQHKVKVFVTETNLSCSLESRLLDLVSEVGELSKEMLEATHYGQQAFTPTAAFTDEYGDVLFALLCVANEAGVDVDAALAASLVKYTARLNASGSA